MGGVYGDVFSVNITGLQTLLQSLTSAEAQLAEVNAGLGALGTNVAEGWSGTTGQKLASGVAQVNKRGTVAHAQLQRFVVDMQRAIVLLQQAQSAAAQAMGTTGSG
jgi:hypothetical protein